MNVGRRVEEGGAGGEVGGSTDQRNVINDHIEVLSTLLQPSTHLL